MCEQVVLPRVYAAFDESGRLRAAAHEAEATAVLDGLVAALRRAPVPA